MLPFFVPLHWSIHFLLISINDDIHNPTQPKSDENLLVYDPTQPFDQIAFQRPPFIFLVGWCRKHTLTEETYLLKRESSQKMLDLYYIFWSASYLLSSQRASLLTTKFREWRHRIVWISSEDLKRLASVLIMRFQESSTKYVLKPNARMILAGGGMRHTMSIRRGESWQCVDPIWPNWWSPCEQIFLASCILSGGSTSTFIKETERKTQRCKYVEC